MPIFCGSPIQWNYWFNSLLQVEDRMTPLWVLADTVLLLVCWEGLQAHGQQLGTTIIANIQKQSWVEIKHNLSRMLSVGWYSLISSIPT